MSTKPKAEQLAQTSKPGPTSSPATTKIRRISFGSLVFFMTVFLSIAIASIFIVDEDDKGVWGYIGAILSKATSWIGPLLRFLVATMDSTRTPVLNDTITLSGLNDKVEVYWDSHGVPHIYATNNRDMLFAAGYVHAQDRLWQMEMNRRIATGRMAEALGESGLIVDRIFRTFGLARKAQKDLEVSSNRALLLLEAYTDGINAYLKNSKGQLPVEFTFLSISPETWSSVDVLAIGRLMCWQMGAGEQSEFPRQMLKEVLGDKLMKEFDISYPDNPSTLSFPAGKHEFNPIMDGVNLNEVLPPYIKAGGASNAWSVSGSLTSTGKPFLANDPHLTTSAPSAWYRMHMHSSDADKPYHAIGVTLPGTPVIAIGHNEHIGWGITVSMADTKDLFVEKFFANGTYEHEGQAVQPIIRQEVIAVKGKAPHVEEVIETVHGPIISDLFGILNETQIEYQKTHSHTSVAYASIGLLPQSTMSEGQYELNLAHDWDSFVSAVKKMDIGSFNLVYGDVQGNIGYYLSGLVPIRKKGDGALPSPGWTGEHDWHGYIPFDEKPFALNPKSGYVVSANHKIAGDDYPHYLGNMWNNGYRAKRIEDMIQDFAARGVKLSLREQQLIQTDVFTIPGKEFVEKFLKFLDLNDQADFTDLEKEAMSELRGWNGSMTRTTVAGSLYQSLRYFLVRDILKSKVPSVIKHNMHGSNFMPISTFGEFIGYDIVNILRLMDNPQSEWWSDLGGRSKGLRKAFRDSVNWLVEEFGENVQDWHWGRIHRSTFAHLLGKQKPFNLVFDVGPQPVDGDDDTVARSGFAKDERHRKFDAINGISFRQIIDFSDFDNSKWILAPGQSGRLSSPYHHDMMEVLERKEYSPMYWKKENVVRAAKHLLVLQP
jgi:penicillin amidase